jgi:hypothetical protein
MKIYLTFIILALLSMVPFAGIGQLVSVSGYVKNGFSGTVLENATVYESISGIGTISNKDGYYRLLLQKGEQNLKISSAGMQPFIVRFTLQSDTIISPDLLPADLQGNRVVEAGKEKKDTSGVKTTGKKR